MTAELHEQLLSSRSPELPKSGFLQFELIQGGGEDSVVRGELSVVPEIETPELELVDEIGDPEFTIVVSGIPKARKKELLEEPEDNTKSRKVINMEEEVAKRKKGGGSSWAICDCGCKIEAKFGNCANMGYVRLDRKKFA